MSQFQIGDIVRLKHTSDFPIGGWLHNELAVVCGGSYSKKMLIVKLKNKVLRDALQQDAAAIWDFKSQMPSTQRDAIGDKHIVVSFGNVTKCLMK